MMSTKCLAAEFMSTNEAFEVKNRKTLSNWLFLPFKLKVTVFGCTITHSGECHQEKIEKKLKKIKQVKILGKTKELKIQKDRKGLLIQKLNHRKIQNNENCSKF
ncbi:hypothetical protein EGR_05373 [Echinococcus granulosus]|uniref:Uncharacterized protein n=1 Tax=Echinococcus granulosus TaxID=6210 RepID=W6UF60_ECHGR|nr:hypothetical protein EGR_05373 [Echinococcus granulosus]EUB59753.1 hypothetical protein EGR_05373 [Echinococcus granulosus]